MQLPRLILASGSPRRAEILSAVGWEFEVQVSNADESLFDGETPREHVERLSKLKSETIAKQRENAFVLGADTIVLLDGEIIGKPKDIADARRMLRKLSGVWHEVLTGVSIAQNKNGTSTFKTDTETTRVKFAELSDKEIDFLVHEGAPLDKAGAYAVQAQAALFIEKIEGDYWNVTGLPVHLVYRLVSKYVFRN